MDAWRKPGPEHNWREGRFKAFESGEEQRQSVFDKPVCQGFGVCTGVDYNERSINSYRPLLLLIRTLGLPHRDGMGEKEEQLPLVTAVLIQAGTAVYHLQRPRRKSIQISVLLSTCWNTVEGVLISVHSQIPLLAFLS